MNTEAERTRSVDKSQAYDVEDNDLQLVSTDARELAALGHAQELQRKFSVWSLACLCLCLMATWEALGSVLALALLSGGAPCLFYNYIITFLGTIAIAFSLAEMASIYPTAGGQYHWVAALAPMKYRRTASWFTGWISIGGQICLTASAAFAGGLQLRGMIALNNPNYLPTQWQGMLFYWAVLLYAFLINLTGAKTLSATNVVSGVLHLVGFLALTATIGALAPKHDAHYVFVETQNLTGWPNDGVAWMVGLLSTVYPFLGYDAAAHLAEEIPHPSRNVPVAMVGSVLVNGILGFIYCLILLFGLGDLTSLLESATGFPFMQLNLNTTNNAAGATVMSLIPTLVAIAATGAGLTSTSRTFWAFARDEAIPFHGFFAHVNPKLKIPIRMIVLISILQFLLGFIYLGSTTAFNAVLSMAILGMYLSYALPIVCMLFYGRGPNGPRPGQFKMGRTVGAVTNVIALIFLVVAMFFSTWPNFYPVVADNMNYSVVVLAGWVIIGAVYYFTVGVRTYDGPVTDLPAH